MGLEIRIYCKLRNIFKEVKLIGGVLKSEDSGARLPDFESWFCLLAAV